MKMEMEKLFLRSEIQEFILNNCLIFDIDDSDKNSLYLFDLRILLLSKDISESVAELFRHILKPASGDWRDNKIDYILATGVGGLALAMNLTKEINSDVCFLRDSPKTRNRIGRVLEGPELKPKSNVLLVDDLINSGKTIDKIKKIAEDNQCNIVGIATIVDMDYAGVRRYEATGHKVHSLFTRRELGITRKSKDDAPITRPELSWAILDWNKGFVPNYVHGEPILYEDSIICGNDQSRISRIDINTGEIKWTVQAPYHPKGITTDPVIDNNRIYFASYGSSLLHEVSAFTGRILSRVQVGTSIHSTPIVTKDKIWVMSEVWNGKPGGLLVCLDRMTRKTIQSWLFEDYTPTHLHRQFGHIYCASNDGKIWRVNETTLVRELVLELPKDHVVKGWFQELAGWVGKAFICNKLLFLDNKGVGYIHDVEENTTISRRLMRASHHVKPVVYGDEIVWYGNYWITCTDFDLNILSVRQLYGCVNGKPQIDDNVGIVSADTSGRLTWYDPTSNCFINIWQLPDSCRQQPIITKDRIIVPTDSKGLFCYVRDN